MGDMVIGNHLKLAIVALGLLALHACGSEGDAAVSSSNPAATAGTWSVPGDLLETADALVATRGGLVLVGHEGSELVLALGDLDSAEWSQTMRLSEGFGWQVADTGDGPIAVGAVCDRPSVDTGCEPGALHLRAHNVSAEGAAAPMDGPHLSGVSVDGVDLQVAAVGESAVVAVRSATDAATLYSLGRGLWREIGVIEPVRRMCATADALHIQSFIVADSPEQPVVRMPTPSKTPPTDPPGGGVPASSGTAAASVAVGGKQSLDSASTPLIMRTFDRNGLSASTSIGSTVEGSLDGEIGCTRERADVMVGGEWQPLAASDSAVKANLGTPAWVVLIGAEAGQIPGVVEVTEDGKSVVRVIDGSPIELPSNVSLGGSIIAAARLGDAKTALLVADGSSADIDAEPGSNTPRRIVLVPDRQ